MPARLSPLSVRTKPAGSMIAASAAKQAQVRSIAPALGAMSGS